MEIGVPVVRPSNTPDKISTVSSSFLGVAKRFCPGFLLSRYFCISPSLRERPAGQPSTTTPTPAPWDSPQVEARNNVPYIEPDILVLLISSILQSIHLYILFSDGAIPVCAEQIRQIDNALLNILSYICISDAPSSGHLLH